MVDIESITGREHEVALFVADYLRGLGARVEVEGSRAGTPERLCLLGPAAGDSLDAQRHGASP